MKDVYHVTGTGKNAEYEYGVCISYPPSDGGAYGDPSELEPAAFCYQQYTGQEETRMYWHEKEQCWVYHGGTPYYGMSRDEMLDDAVPALSTAIGQS